ncbi:GspE/PulE family protein [Paracidovorax citrulli]
MDIRRLDIRRALKSAAAFGKSRDAVPDSASSELEENWDAGDSASLAGVIPPFERLLTAPDGPYALGEGPRGILAAVQVSQQVAAILVLERAKGGNEQLSLFATLRATYRTVRVVVVGHSQLRQLYAEAMKGRTHVQQRLDGEAAPASATFHYMIELGVKRNADDLHILVSEENDVARLRYRINGDLIELDQIRPASIATEALMYAYTKMAEKQSRSHNTFNTALDQSCSVPVAVAGDDYTLRWQSSKQVGGFKVSLRLLRTRPGNSVPTLQELGYSNAQCELLSLLVRSKGAIVLSGETNSGKSTTLRTLAYLIPNKEKKSIVFIEDPVEYRKAGCEEISVQRTANEDGDPFLAAMRVAMRIDPDVLIPGEIRDRAGAQLFEFAVDSGHKGMTTTHASSAAMAIRKLSSDTIGMSREVLGSRNFLAGVGHGALVQTVCPHCRLPADQHLDNRIAKLLTEKFGLDLSGIFVTNPAGCDHCHGGSGRRTMVAEVMPITQEIRELIRAGKDGEAEDAYRNTRRTDFRDADTTGKTIFEHGLYKVQQGLIDPLVLAEALDEPFEMYEIQPIRVQP